MREIRPLLVTDEALERDSRSVLFDIAIRIAQSKRAESDVAPAPEEGGFLIPREMVPGARRLAGLCVRCGHALDFGEYSYPDERDPDAVKIMPIEVYNNLKCRVCGCATTDEITLEDIEIYDSKRDSN